MALIFVKAENTDNSQQECGYLKFDSGKPLHVTLSMFLFKIPGGHYDFVYSSNADMRGGSFEICERFSADLKEDEMVTVNVKTTGTRVYGEPTFEVSRPDPEILQALYEKSDTISEILYQDFKNARNAVLDTLADHPEWPQSYRNQVRTDLEAKLSTIDRRCEMAMPIIQEWIKNPNSSKSSSSSSSTGGCYVATCVYGSYDCPEVWTLRRYRDNTLGTTWYGRLFIRTYYAISPTLVKWFGNANWFKTIWRGKLNRTVAKLQKNGVESTPYEDKMW